MHEFALLKKNYCLTVTWGCCMKKGGRGEHTALDDVARACRCFCALGNIISVCFKETKTAHYTNEEVK